MPLAKRFFSISSAALARRFASEASRFRLAVATGFVFAAAGFLTIAFDQRLGLADVMWGSMSFSSVDQSSFGQTPAPARISDLPTVRQRRHLARRHLAERPHLVRFSREREMPVVHHERGAPIELGRKSMCVRLCDGFAFPVGAYHGEQDRASHEATCQSECPGAQTALYVTPSGSDSIGDAVRVGTGQNYSKLPDAFHYTTVLSDACSCHPKSGSRIASLLRDFTLRRGDAVMTARGFQVFHGGAHYPFRRTDFVALAKSGDIRKNDRATFHAIERASLMSDPVQSIRISMKGGAKPKEHQASR